VRRTGGRAPRPDHFWEGRGLMILRGLSPTPPRARSTAAPDGAPPGRIRDGKTALAPPCPERGPETGRARIRSREAGGTPHPARHKGGRVTPTLNERRGGGWGITPSPPGPRTALFLHGSHHRFAWRCFRGKAGERSRPVKRMGG
jgi:hypothetical protein